MLSKIHCPFLHFAKKSRRLFTINVYYLKAAPLDDLDFEMPRQIAKSRDAREIAIRINTIGTALFPLTYIGLYRARCHPTEQHLEAHLRFNATLQHYVEIWSCFECLHRVTVRRINHDLGIVISVNRRKSG